MDWEGKGLVKHVARREFWGEFDRYEDELTLFKTNDVYIE